MDGDTNVRNMATDLQDTTSLAKIGGALLQTIRAKMSLSNLTLAFPKKSIKLQFKDPFLTHFPDAQAQNDGKNILLIFKYRMKKMLKPLSKKQKVMHMYCQKL